MMMYVILPTPQFFHFGQILGCNSLQPNYNVTTHKEIFMGYADIIAREANSLPEEKQAEVLDFIEFLKTRQFREKNSSVSMAADEIERFFRSFNVNTRDFKFSRDEANAR